MNGLHLNQGFGQSSTFSNANNSGNFRRSMSTKTLNQEPWTPNVWSAAPAPGPSNGFNPLTSTQVFYKKTCFVIWRPKESFCCQNKAQDYFQHTYVTDSKDALREFMSSKMSHCFYSQTSWQNGTLRNGLEVPLQGNNHLAPPSLEGSSPSINSNRSSKKGGKRKSKKSKRNSSKPPSRCGSSNSKNGRRNNNASRHTESSDEESDSEDEDFFTGESEEDFLSLSSGSNSKKALRNIWKCDFCTFVNDPGTNVCAMCCKTKLSDETGVEGETAFLEPKKSREVDRTGRSRPRHSSDESEDRARGRRTGARSKSTSRLKTSSRSRTRNEDASPRPRGSSSRRGEQTEENLSDLERDVVDTYYAVRMGREERNKGKGQEGFDEKGSFPFH
jgi:hypothetical protein